MARLRNRIAAILLGIALAVPATGSAQATAGGQAQASQTNALVAQAKTAMAAREWQQAADALDKLIALDPRAEYYQELGNALLKLKRNEDAIAAYTQAATRSPHPGTAYFNLCAVEYNLGSTDRALASCNAAIKADPAKADAYFIKGSLLYGNAALDKNNKYVVPAGTVEILRKYLQLAPGGGHVADVQAMLDALKDPAKP